MCAHISDANEQHWSSHAVTLLAFSEAHHGKLLAASACAALVAGMRAHPSHLDMRQSGARAMGNLAAGDDNSMDKPGAAGACELVVAGMRSYGSDGTCSTTAPGSWRS